MVVSKPPRGALATGASACAEAPPSTRQLATCVAPFQEAYTVVAGPLAPAAFLACVVAAAIAGGSLGWPAHWKR